MLIRNNSLVLFQGDSVTDCGRDRSQHYNLGTGYPMMVAAAFTALHPEKKVRFVNRGISGNRVKNLKDRWKEDCLDLNPDIVSILIGINDCWRRYDNNDPTSAEEFEASYRDILSQIKQKTNASIILCEPLLLPVKEEQVAWREDLDPKIQVVRKLAREYKAFLISLDGIFAEASAKAELTVWTEDGVHPTAAGHALIAKSWLETVKAI